MYLLKNVKRVAIGVSGGVDSTVAALMVKKCGIDVVGVFMKNWDIVDETGHCSASADAEDAAYVCDKLRIPFVQADFVKAYWNEVFQHLIEDYENGVTPNPDVLCNKFIKFKRFCDFAEDKLGCDAIATGHYAQRSYPTTPACPVSLLKARDVNKDQTFFLSQISQKSLQKASFPLGNLLKHEVKKIATDHGLGKIAKKKESMGMCFIGSRRFQSFIEEYIEEKEGVFIDVDTGKQLGRHFGKHHFTVGQRCRLGGHSDRYYIARKSETEDILVALGHDHDALYGQYVFASPPHWIRSKPEELLRSSLMRCQFRFQHRDPLIGCTIFEKSDDHLVVMLDEPLRALTAGQYAVFYQGNECLGSSRMLYSGPTEFTLNFANLSSEESNRAEL